VHITPRATSRPLSAANGSAAERAHGDADRGYQLNIEKAARIVCVRLWGVWDLAVVNRFAADMLAAAKLFTPLPWCALVDGRNFVTQSPEISDIRQKTMIKLAQLGCTRIANVAKSAAYTMQFTRLTSASHIASQVFLDEGSARAWLTAGRKRHPA
jgi:hypothetical protein